MQIFIGADHRGFEKKQQLLPLLVNFEVFDCGATEPNPEDDYNDPAISVAQQIAAHPDARGILLCGSAHGVCMQANRFPGVRAINATTTASAQTGRQHNDANVLCLAADNLSLAEMSAIIQVFLATANLPDEKYHRRNVRLDQGGTI